MFWRFGGYANISTLDNILDKPDVTVEELLDESDLIQELKQQNSKLVEFLREEPVLQKLLAYVIAEKPPEAVEAEELERKGGGADSAQERDRASVSGGGLSFFGKGKSLGSRSKSQNLSDGGDGETEADRREAQRKKYAYVACEVLSSEVWSITEALLQQQDHLRAFWRYLYRPAPLDALQAGYFTKVNESLFDKKTEEMLAFFQSLEDIVPAMLQHVDCPMIMDLLLKIISLEKHEGGAGIVDWLQSQDLIPLLLGYLSPRHSSATQTSAGDFLKAIITISANATTQDQSVIGPNELTRQLVSERCIKTLIEDMLRGGNPLTVGVGIIIEVIRKNNSDYDLENQVGPEPKTSDPIYLGTLLRQFAINVPNFMHLIRSKSAAKPDLRAAYGGKIEPLGFDRFKTCELMAELLHCSNMGLLNERGAEDEVRRRDGERDKLRAEGKLMPSKIPPSPGNGTSLDEFGSSVDSHGFHHAKRPSDDEFLVKSEEGRRLEVQNVSDEDGFEKVNAPSADELPDEVTFDEFDEKIEQTGLPPLEKTTNRPPISPTIQSPTGLDKPKPLSPSKQVKQEFLNFDPPPKQAADSPTTAGVTDRIDKLDVDEDTVMTEFGEEPTRRDDDEPSELERELAKFPEDRPAPLFSRKLTEEPSKDTFEDMHRNLDSEEHPDVDQSVATIQGEQSGISNAERSPYETEADGSAVVGDLLKIQFVEHQVVPTILDFFFRFPWNNFLHNVVYDVVQQVFNGTLDRGFNRTLAFDLFVDVPVREGTTAEDLGLVSLKDITARILDGQRASEVSQGNKGMRLGYMGHLTLIAEEVCKFGNRHPTESLDQTVHDRVNREEWVSYVEGTLTETRDRDNAVLGGVRPQDSIGGRGMGFGGSLSGFTNNTANALANAGLTPQDSLAMSEGTVGQSFEINSGSMLSGLHADDQDDDGDEEMTEDDNHTGARGKSAADVAREAERGGDGGGDPFSDDEQTPSALSQPPPLAIPTLARQRLAARLELRRKAEQEAAEQQGRLASSSSAERFSSLFRSGSDEDLPHRGTSTGTASDSSSEDSENGGNSADYYAAYHAQNYNPDDYDAEGQAGRDYSLDRDDEEDDGQSAVAVTARRFGGAPRWSGRGAAKAARPRTMEVTGQRRLLDDEDDDDDDVQGRSDSVEDEDDDDDDDDEEDGRGTEGRFVGRYDFRTGNADDDDDDDSSSDEEELVEIRPVRRRS